MIDLDFLEYVIKKAWYTRTEEEDAVHSHAISELGILDLITRLRQAEKDAARYGCIKSIARVIECEEFDMDMLDGQDLDAMVDECIEAMK